MNKTFARLVTHLYPRSWRDRYGEEFEMLLMTQYGPVRILLDVVRSALKEQVLPTRAWANPQCRPSFPSMMRKPSALLPMAMSLAALGVVIVQIAVDGIARQTDEGAAVHSWQLLMTMQLPLLIVFAFKWLPKAPRQTLGVIAMQAIAAGAAMAPVFLLRW